MFGDTDGQFVGVEPDGVITSATTTSTTAGSTTTSNYILDIQNEIDEHRSEL